MEHFTVNILKSSQRSFTKFKYMPVFCVCCKAFSQYLNLPVIYRRQYAKSLFKWNFMQFWREMESEEVKTGEEQWVFHADLSNASSSESLRN